MRSYVIRRILLLFPTVLLLSFLVFGIIRMLPGDAVELMVSEGGYADDTEELREMLGLDQPVFSQFFKYMKGVVRGDLGISLWSGQPVLSEISRRLPISFELALMALIWTLILGVPIGVISALKQYTGTDYTLRSLAIGALSVPGFWLDLAQVDPAHKLHSVQGRSHPESFSTCCALFRPFPGPFCRHHEDDENHDAGGDAGGLHSNGPGQRTHRVDGGHPPCPEERHDPRRQHHGDPTGISGGRNHHYGEYLYPAGHGQVSVGRHRMAGLSGNTGDQSLYLHVDHHHQPLRGFVVRIFGSKDPTPVEARDCALPHASLEPF